MVPLKGPYSRFPDPRQLLREDSFPLPGWAWTRSVWHPSSSITCHCQISCRLCSVSCRDCHWILRNRVTGKPSLTLQSSRVPSCPRVVRYHNGICLPLEWTPMPLCSFKVERMALVANPSTESIKGCCCPGIGKRLRVHFNGIDLGPWSI